jgi:uncharacterized tellurite resistance protein B-like protein
MNANTNQAGTIVCQAIAGEIIATLEKPNGFSKLKPDQRKYLLAIVLGSIVPADGKVKEVETTHLKQHLQQKYGLSPETLKLAMSHANTGLCAEHLKKAAQQLPELLSMEDRTSLIGMLWDLAVCDNELHSSEEVMIYNIADSSGVPRKRVAEQQARMQVNRGN